MDTLLISSDNKSDIELLRKLVKKMGLHSRLLSETEKEDYGLLIAMLEADRSDHADTNMVMEKLEEKCK